MFPKIFGQKEEVLQRDAEERDRSFQREQQQLNQSKDDDSSYIYGQESKSDLLRWQQDLDDELFSLIEMMLGRKKTYDSETQNYYWEQISPEICNVKFITEVVIPQCKPFMTRNIINTNWSEKLILSRLKITSNAIADAMSDHWDRYNIDFTNNDMVLNQIKTTIIAGAYRSLNGWTKKIDSTMIKRNEMINEQMNKQQKKGLWGVFSG